jgi:hypothetical protein
MPEDGQYNERRRLIGNRCQSGICDLGCSPPGLGLEPFAPFPRQEAQSEWQRKTCLRC